MIISNFLSWLSILNFMYLKLPQKGKLIIIIISLSSYIPLKTLYFFCIRVVHTKDIRLLIFCTLRRCYLNAMWNESGNVICCNPIVLFCFKGLIF